MGPTSRFSSILSEQTGKSVLTTYVRMKAWVEVIGANIRNPAFPETGAEEDAPTELKWGSDKAKPLREDITRAFRKAMGCRDNDLVPAVTHPEWQRTSKFVIAIWVNRGWIPVQQPIQWKLPPSQNPIVHKYLSALRDLYFS